MGIYHIMSAFLRRSTTLVALAVLCALGVAAFSSTHHAGRAASTAVAAKVIPADDDSQWG